MHFNSFKKIKYLKIRIINKYFNIKVNSTRIMRFTIKIDFNSLFNLKKKLINYLQLLFIKKVL